MAPVKRYAVGAGAGLAALVLLAGGVAWFGGGYDRWQSARLVTDACDGVLPADEVRAVLGDRRLKAGKDTSEGSLDATTTSLRVTCGIARGADPHDGAHPGEATMTVTVSGVPTLDREDRRYESLYPPVRSTLPPAPLGQGWSGVFAMGHSSGEARATTSVLLDCSPGRGDLLVTVAVEGKKYLDDSPLDNPERRTAFARVATATAANASRRWNCDADLGEPPATVPLPVNEDEYVVPADAEGACSGVTARGKRVDRVWESGSGAAPIEECVLGGAKGTASRLTALYGPYAEGARHDAAEHTGKPHPSESGQRSGVLDEGDYWTSAECPGDDGPALFGLTGGHDDETQEAGADRAYALSVLKTFAERSAAAHGCAAPAAPTATTAP
ncbi:hypothetical protein ACH4NC_30110 [Streptomyces sp. NPDC017201]|uniref:hypothetical protein n=1 Tax=unclassified Streptomyces TaxID=2593676 RepID=UPI0033A61CC8